MGSALNEGRFKSDYQCRQEDRDAKLVARRGGKEDCAVRRCV